MKQVTLKRQDPPLAQPPPGPCTQICIHQFVLFFLERAGSPAVSMRHRTRLRARVSPRPVRWVALCPLKRRDVLTPGPVNVSLLGNKVFGRCTS